MRSFQSPNRASQEGITDPLRSVNEDEWTILKRCLAGFPVPTVDANGRFSWATPIPQEVASLAAYLLQKHVVEGSLPIANGIPSHAQVVVQSPRDKSARFSR